MRETAINEISVENCTDDWKELAIQKPALSDVYEPRINEWLTSLTGLLQVVNPEDCNLAMARLYLLSHGETEYSTDTDDKFDWSDYKKFHSESYGLIVSWVYKSMEDWFKIMHGYFTENSRVNSRLTAGYPVTSRRLTANRHLGYSCHLPLDVVKLAYEIIGKIDKGEYNLEEAFARRNLRSMLERLWYNVKTARHTERSLNHERMEYFSRPQKHLRTFQPVGGNTNHLDISVVASGLLKVCKHTDMRKMESGIQGYLDAVRNTYLMEKKEIWCFIYKILLNLRNASSEYEAYDMYSSFAHLDNETKFSVKEAITRWKNTLLDYRPEYIVTLHNFKSPAAVMKRQVSLSDSDIVNRYLDSLGVFIELQ